MLSLLGERRHPGWKEDSNQLGHDHGSGWLKAGEHQMASQKHEENIEGIIVEQCEHKLFGLGGCSLLLLVQPISNVGISKGQTNGTNHCNTDDIQVILGDVHTTDGNIQKDTNQRENTANGMYGMCAMTPVTGALFLICSHSA